jgi:hypothetical protein
MTKEQIAQSIVPIAHNARRVSATVYRLPGRYEVAVQLQEDGEEKPRFARRYRHPNLDQLLAIASTQETAAVAGSPDWRQPTLDSIREAIFEAQDIEGPPTVAPAVFRFDPKTSAGEAFHPFWSAISAGDTLFIDYKAMNMITVGLDPEGKGLEVDTAVVQLGAAALILACRHHRNRDFGKNDVLKLLDTTRQILERLPAGSTPPDNGAGAA